MSSHATDLYSVYAKSSSSYNIDLDNNLGQWFINSDFLNKLFSLTHETRHCSTVYIAL